MSARADFQVFTFNEHLGDNQGDIDTDFDFKGQRSSKRTFEINQTLFEVDGYVSYQVSHVDDLAHEILINDRPLPAVDVFRSPAPISACSPDWQFALVWEHYSTHVVAAACLDPKSRDARLAVCARSECRR